MDWVGNAAVDNAYGGAFVARHCIEADGLCDSMAYWTASDVFEELGLPHAPYTGTYGLLTIHGLPKATLHAMALAKRMEGDRLPVEPPSPPPPGCGLVATRTPGSVRVLLWNCPRPGDPDASAWNGAISLPNPFGRAVLIHTRLGVGHGSAYETWVAMGRPQNLSVLEDKLLRAHAQPAMDFQLVSGERTVDVPLALGLHEVLSLEISAAGGPGPAKGEQSAAIAIWNGGMGETAT